MYRSMLTGLFLASLLFPSLYGVAQAARNGHVVREDIEWLDVWMPNTNDHSLPRVLLIGDSVTRAYGPRVESLLKGQAYVARMATSKSLGDPAYLQEVALILNEQQFEIIHFNNGLHGADYSEKEYANTFPKLLAVFHRYAPKSRLIWASITDVRVENHLDRIDPFTERVVRRNAIASAYCEHASIPIDDLFSLVKDHPEYHVTDGVHYGEAGIDAQAIQVSTKLKEMLAASSAR